MRSPREVAQERADVLEKFRGVFAGNAGAGGELGPALVVMEPVARSSTLRAAVDKSGSWSSAFSRRAGRSGDSLPRASWPSASLRSHSANFDRASLARSGWSKERAGCQARKSLQRRATTPGECSERSTSSARR